MNADVIDPFTAMGGVELPAAIKANIRIQFYTENNIYVGIWVLIIW